MKLQFDANQQYQLDAISVLTDIFDRQPQGAPEFAVIPIIIGLFCPLVPQLLHRHPIANAQWQHRLDSGPELLGLG